MSEKKVFEYNLMDAWHAPIYSVTIPESDQNIVYYAISAHRLFPDINGEIKTVEISDKAMEEVRRLISTSKAYEISEVEENKDCIVLDGYIQEFYITDGCGGNAIIQAYNLQSYRTNRKIYPKVSSLRKLLKDLSKVLVPEGVDARCFRLTSESE